MEDLNTQLQQLSDSWQSLFKESETLERDTENLTQVSGVHVHGFRHTGVFV